MNRGEAIARIQEDLGFTTGQADVIRRRLTEAQEELERGKSLPYVLLATEAGMTVPQGTLSIAYPEDFLRVEESSQLRTLGTRGERSRFLDWVVDLDDSAAFFSSGGVPAAPRAVYAAPSGLYFINPVDKEYIFIWSYWRRGEPLVADGQTNAWLENRATALWLMGEAGHSLALSKRDKDAVTIFDRMRTRGRSAAFGETLARDQAIGPLYMGSHL